MIENKEKRRRGEKGKRGRGESSDVIQRVVERFHLPPFFPFSLFPFSPFTLFPL
jgi:hypothetical protein